MSHVARDADYEPIIINNNNAYSHIDGNGNTINNNNRNINFVLSPQARVNPSVVITNALKKHHVADATFEAQTENGCMEGTRVQFLEDVLAVLKSLSGPRIVWVAGMAGTGKTSIALTLCNRLAESSSTCLGGTFFCSRSAGSIERTDVRRIIPTLAASLARQLPDYAVKLEKELEREPEVSHRPVRAQLEFLLKHPLEKVVPLGNQIIFVVDALDECSDQGQLAELLNALADLNEDFRVKFLLTSRPEMHIRDSPINDPGLSSILQLHTIDPDQVMGDIRLYISKTLENASSSTSWYSTSDVDALVRLSAGLFIFAATVLKYIRDRGTVRGRQERLRKATSAVKASHAAIAPVDRIYEFILTEASRSDCVDDDELLATQNVLACILVIRASISVDALAELIRVEAEDLRECLERLHSVVYLPQDNKTSGVRTLHASFGDYLYDRASSSLRIERPLGDGIMARGCLQVMEKCLHFNISRSRSSYKANSLASPQTVTLSLRYACLQWIYHVASLEQPSLLDEKISKVFRPGFLFWLEVISILGLVRRAAAMLIFSAATVRDPELSRFLRDANIFVASSHEAIERSAPHIYLSALVFAAQDSLVYQDFAQLCIGVARVNTIGINRHGGRLVMTLTGHEGSVESLAHSPDGYLLASGSRDGTLRIWDMRTGDQAMLPLQRLGDSVCSVAFSPNGKHVASGVKSGIVQIWDVVSGTQALHPSNGHSAAIFAVIFAPDGRLIASASADRTVRIWIVETGAVSTVLTGHKGVVRAIAFSPDGGIIASGSDDRTIRLSQVNTGRLVIAQPLSTDDMGISSVCFSPDGRTLASSSYDGSIRLWAWAESKNTGLLRGHFNSVYSICFSPDGRSIFSASSDTTVRLWDLQNGHGDISAVIIGRHAGPVNAVSCSPNGLYVASASEDGTIRLWNAGDSDMELQPLPAHTAGVNSVVVSPNSLFIVSGSTDRSVGVWDIQTGAPILQPFSGHEGAVYSVDISSDGRLIASGSADRTVRLWNAQKGHAVGAPRYCEFEVRQVSFSSDIQWLAAGSSDGTVTIWDISTWLPTAVSPLRCVSDLYGTYSRSLGPIRMFSMAFSPDGEQLAVGTCEANVQLWLTATGKPVEPPLLPSLRLVVGVIPESYLRSVSGQLDRPALRVIFEQVSEACLRTAVIQLSEIGLRALVNQLLSFDLSTHSINKDEPKMQVAVGWRPQPKSSGTGGWLSKLNLRAAVSQLPQPSLRAVVSHLPTVELQAVVSPLSQSAPDLLAAVDQLPESIWRVVVGQLPESALRIAFDRLPVIDLLAALSHLPSSVRHAIVSQLPQASVGAIVDQLSPSESVLRDAVTQLPETILRVLAVQLPESDLRTAVSRLPESALRDSVSRLAQTAQGAFSGNAMSSGRHQFLHRLAELELDPISDILALWGEGTRSVAFSADGLTAVSGVERGTVYTWNLASRSQLHALEGHLRPVSTVQCSPNGQLIASGSEDCTVRLWDVENGYAPRVRRGHTKAVRSVSFSPNGRSVTSGADDGTIRIWDANLTNTSAADLYGNCHELSHARRDNNWLVGASGELLLWVPQEYMAQIILGSDCQGLISSHRIVIRADERGVFQGEDWTKCWQGHAALQSI